MFLINDYKPTLIKKKMWTDKSQENTTLQYYILKSFFQV